MTCKWETTLGIAPGLDESEIIGEYHFKIDANGQTFVPLSYTTEAFDEKHPDRKSHSEYADQTICDKHIEKIRELLLIRMIHQEYFQPIHIKILKRPTLLNRDELEESGAKLRRTITAGLEMPYGIFDTSNKISDAVSFFENCENITTNREFLIQVAKWLAKPEVNQNNIENFRVLWTSFNSIFQMCAESQNKTRDNEIKKIKGIVNLLFHAEDAKTILDSQKNNLDLMVSFNLISQKNVTFSENLKNAIKGSNQDYLLTLKLALLCVYGIRNEIFHDGPRVENIDNKAKVGKEFLMPFLAKCLKKLLQ
jgi:hypothetical protein